MVEAGTRLHAKFTDGEFYPATVLEVSTAKKRQKAPVKVHFEGYGAESDIWLPYTSLKSKKLLDTQGKAKSKPKAPDYDLSVLKPGNELQALADDGKWYKATVVSVATKKKQVKVTYSGYTSASDELLGPERLRSGLLKPKSEPKAASGGKSKSKQPAVSDIGIVGAGVMGSNLGLNIADKKTGDRNYEVSLFDLSEAQINSVMSANPTYKNLHGFGGKDKFKDFVASLQKPRKAIILVPAGKITDSVINDLSAEMDKNDIIIDVGNANFRDQIRRAEALEKKGMRFLGMGVSGGAEGARKGPAFFPGGTLSVWDDVKDIVCAAAAKAEDGRPCATMNGKGGAGSCVKMYHNAGEYAVLQIWAEVYEIMKSFGCTGEQQASILESWSTKTGGRYEGLLKSYMLDITVEVVKAQDSAEAGGAADSTPLITKTMDKTDSKGTGLWSVVEALGAACPAPSLVASVLARQMSMLKEERLKNADTFKLPAPKATWDKELEEDLFWAAGFAIIASYAQMFQCLRKLDEVFEFGLNLPATIATFRAGCILQGFLLNPMTKAFEDNPNLPNLMNAFEPELKDNLHRYKRLIAKVATDTSAGIPVMSASLAYIQTMFCTEIPASQCVSLQRDVFGRHGFERLDKEGRFNAQWKQLQEGIGECTAATSHQVISKALSRNFG